MRIARERLSITLFAILVLLQPATTLGAPRTPLASDKVAANWPAVALRRVPGSYEVPVHLTHAGDSSGRLFVVEKRGVIRIIRHGQNLQEPFLDISDRVNSSCNECGLLSVAFPPDFETGGYFFVNYTSKQNLAKPEPPDNGLDSGNDSVIARFRLSSDPNRADSASEERILVRNQPHTNHNGGLIAFAPDGYLYFGLGDGGGSGDPLKNGQRPNTWLGKILRLEVGATGTYTVPADNPFDMSTPHLPEIWSMGLRNPWRFSFDRLTGDLYIADVGQNKYEEVNFQPASGNGGENYGWNVMEGMHCYNADQCDPTELTLPVYEYAHPQDGCASITGGTVYRGLYTEWQGIYFFADYCSGRISGLRRSGSAWQSKPLLDTGISIMSFGEDEAGGLYVVGLEPNGQGESVGVVYQLTQPYALYLPSLQKTDSN